MSKIKSIHWDITRNCNLRCEHCYNAEKYFNAQSSEYISEEMDLQKCLDTVKKVSDAGFQHIHFLGGEPLASPYIFDVIRYAKERNMTITINSNACLLDEQTRKLLLDLKVDQFAASLDGCTPDVNDAIRGEGTFQKVISNMKLLNGLKRDMNAKLETVFVFALTKRNIGDLKLLPALAKEIGVDLIALTTFIESGKGKENSDVFNLEFDKLCDSIEEMVADELTKYPINLQIDMRPRFCQYLAMKYQAPVIYNRKNSLCCAGEDIWYLEANGNVHPCLVFQLDFGREALKNRLFIKERLDISDKEISEIETSQYWNTFLAAKHDFDVSKISTCQDCRWQEECQPCFADYGDYSKVVEECEWTKKKETTLYESIANAKITILDRVKFNEENQTICICDAPVLELQDEMSMEFWKLLQEAECPDSIYEKVCQEYEVSENSLKYDITEFVCLLVNNHIIRLKGVYDKSDLKKSFIKKDLLACEELDDEIVVFDAENEKFYEFEGIGSFIWRQIDGTKIEDIVEAVCNEYNVDEAVALEDTISFMIDLSEKGLIDKK